MNTFTSRRWLAFSHFLPLMILLGIGNAQYRIIATLLSDNQILTWQIYGAILLASASFTFLYLIWLECHKKSISWIYHLVICLLYCILLAFIISNGRAKIIPFSVPQWMLIYDPTLLPATFLMIPIAFSAVWLLIKWTPNPSSKKLWKSIVPAILIPVSWYVFVQVILPLWRPFNREFGSHVITVLFTISTMAFVFLIIRAVYIFMKNRNLQKPWESQSIRIILFLLLPLLALAIHGDVLFKELKNPFGDFSSHWFYILAIINGTVYLLPNPNKANQRLLLFMARLFCLPFVGYFVLVFLPFLPFSILAIIFFGLGILMLLPLVLVVMQVDQLIKDYMILQKDISIRLVLSLALISTAVLPSILTIVFLNDRSTIHGALEYLYKSEYNAENTINEDAIKRTLENINENRRVGFFTNGMPIISPYYNWLVLDNLTLSQSKQNDLRRVFLDENAELETPRVFPESANVTIDSFKVQTSYDTKGKYWRTWVDFEISNKTNRGGREFLTSFELPAGCWISDYYLDIEGIREPGILAEKTSAMWIYSRIVSWRRDPGLLYYSKKGKINFRIFPFGAQEVRTTGIEFIHTEKIDLQIDGNHIVLGEEMHDEPIETDVAMMIPTNIKQQLQLMRRRPYFHFVIDTSISEEKNSDEYESAIKSFLENNQLPGSAKISYVNSSVLTSDMDDRWQESLESVEYRHGFDASRAIKGILSDHYTSNEGSAPVIIIVSGGFDPASIEASFNDLKFAYPDGEYFYTLDLDGAINPHPLFPSAGANNERFSVRPVRLLQPSGEESYYLREDSKAEILPRKDLEWESFESGESSWELALKMEGLKSHAALHPEEQTGLRLPLIQLSFKSGIMIPLTSYISLENEAQKQMLKRKQEQVLSANPDLDIGDEIIEMSEPGMLVPILLLVALYFVRKPKFKSRFAT